MHYRLAMPEDTRFAFTEYIHSTIAAWNTRRRQQKNLPNAFAPLPLYPYIVAEEDGRRMGYGAHAHRLWRNERRINGTRAFRFIPASKAQWVVV